MCSAHLQEMEAGSLLRRGNTNRFLHPGAAILVLLTGTDIQEGPGVRVLTHAGSGFPPVMSAFADGGSASSSWLAVKQTFL